MGWPSGLRAVVSCLWGKDTMCSLQEVEAGEESKLFVEKMSRALQVLSQEEVGNPKQGPRELETVTDE